MERDVAIERINLLRGVDLRELAMELEIELLGASGKKNKGWAGHVLEAYLGLPRNSSRAPNFGSWELKMVSLVRRKELIAVKETMAITMLDPREVVLQEFETSHLYTKLRKLVVGARIWENVQETRSVFHGVYPFDLGSSDIFETVKADYDEIRQTVLEGGTLSGKMGKYIQPRTKGPGGNAPKTRAFYMRPILISHILGLKVIGEIADSDI